MSHSLSESQSAVTHTTNPIYRLGLCSGSTSIHTQYLSTDTYGGKNNDVKVKVLISLIYLSEAIVKCLYLSTK